MSKTQQIRNALPPGKRITMSALMEAGKFISRKSTENLLGYLQARGEVTLHRDGAELEIERTSSPPPSGKSSGRARKGTATQRARHPGKRKRAVKRARKAARGAPALSYKTLRERMRQRPASQSVGDLALANYLATAAELRRTVEQQVEDIDKDPTLTAALESHDRAAALLQATRLA